jgi:lysophospholipase L1-like esterase
MLLCICGLQHLQLSATWVTFQADLAALPSISPAGVHIVGPFNGWNPASDPMAAVGNGRFTATLQFAAGSYIQYKFVNGNAFGGEEGVLGSCAFNTYRYLQVPMSDTTLPWACFGNCDSACNSLTGSRIACIGNSITWGWGLPNNILQSYPSILQDSLGPGHVVTNFGAPGAAVIRHAGFPYIATEQYRHALRSAPDTVLLMLGTNDAKSAIWGPHGADFVADYDSLCAAFDTLATRPRMVLCLPATAFSALNGIDDSVLAHAIVPAIRAQARRRAWDQIDMRTFTASLAAHFPDGIHPDDSATARMAQEILRIVQMPRPQIQRIGPDLVAPAGYAWQWYFNGDTLATALGGQAQVLLNPPQGDYKVALRVDSLYDHILVSDAISVSVATDAPRQASGLEAFPNPVSSILSWRWAAVEQGQPFELRLLSLEGRVLMQTTVRADAGTLNLQALPTGVYVLEARQGEEAQWRVVVKE